MDPLGANQATTFWVDATTYVPVRRVVTITRPNGTFSQSSTTEFRVLPATSANLALLTPPIPAGFTRTTQFSLSTPAQPGKR